MNKLENFITNLDLKDKLIVRFVKLKDKEINLLNLSEKFKTIPSANKDNYRYNLNSFIQDRNIFDNWNQCGQVFFSPLGVVENKDEAKPQFLFYEIDDYSIIQSPEQRNEKLNIQVLKAKELEKEIGAKLTLVKTYKSIHVYIKLNEKITKNEWVTFQQRLIQKMGSDKSIVNPARLMRLPFFNHTRIYNGEILHTPVELIQLSNETVDVKLLDQQYLPQYDMNFWEPNEVKNQKLRSLKSGINFFDLAEKYLEGFKVDGRKKWATVKCPVHGGESDDSLHIVKEGEDKGAFKCWSGCCSKEIFNKTLEIAKSKGYIPPYGAENIIYHLDVFDRISKTLIENPDPFVREIKIEQIKKDLEFKDNKVWENLQRLADKQLENNCVEQSRELFSQIYNNYIDLDDVFSSELSDFIKVNAVNLGHEPIVLGTLFISYILPLIQNKITLDVYGDGTFTDKLLMFHILVGSTGVGKTGLMNVFGKYLKDIQSDFDVQFKSDFKNFKANPEEYPEPSQRILWTGDTTEAARFEIMKERNFNSTLLEADEASALLDKTKNNTPSDPQFLQNILSIYNGSPLSRTTKGDGTLSVTLNYSIVGGIQPEEIDKVINYLQGDPKGFLPRFMFSIIKSSTTPDIKNHIPPNKLDVKELMLKLEHLPKTQLTFDEKSISLIGELQSDLLKKQGEHSINFNSKEFNASIPKFITQLYRFSAIIHIINKTFTNKKIGIIDCEDVKSANTLITFFLSNYKLLFPKTLEEKIYVKSLEKKSLRWYDLKNINFKDFNGEECSVRDLNDVLYLMSELGFGDFNWDKQNKIGVFKPYGKNNNNLRFIALKFSLLLQKNEKISVESLKESIKKANLYNISEEQLEIDYFSVLDYFTLVNKNIKSEDIFVDDDFIKLNSQNVEKQKKEILSEDEEYDKLMREMYE